MGPEALVFLHIPKNAGTSIRFTLEREGGFVPIKPGQIPKGNRFIVSHYSMDFLIRRRIINRERLEKVFSFCVVRHPVDRAVSAFRYALKTNRVPVSWTFDDFLQCLNREKTKIGGARETRMSHAAPQTMWIEQKLWSGPKAIFLMSNLSDLQAELTNRIGKSIEFPRLNQSRTEPEHISARALELITQIYRSDFSRFGFALPQGPAAS